MGFLNKLRGGGSTAHKPAHSVPLIRAQGAAVSLDKTNTGTINLRKGAQAAHARMSADGLLGIRAGGILVLDRSGSMGHDYTTGAVQELAEMALGFMLQFTPSVDIMPFGSDPHPLITATVDNYQGIIAREVTGRYGSTNLAGALAEVRKMTVQRKQLQFVAVLTDGVPDDYDHRAKDAPATTRVVCELAAHATFLKFIGVREVDYLQFLDDLEDHRPGARLLDNCDTKLYPHGLGSITPEQFSNDMSDEWASTIAAQQAAGILVAP